MGTCEVCGGPCSNRYSVCRESAECRREYRRRAQDALLARLRDEHGWSREGPGWDAVLEQASEYQQGKREEERASRQRELDRRRERHQASRDEDREYNRAWRRDNPERVRAQAERYRQRYPEKLQAKAQEWYLANRDTALERISSYRTALRSTVPGTARLLFLGARARARERRLPFDLTAEWVESELALALESGCPLLGIEITLERSVGRRPPGTPSIDRFRPELGYVQANCWVISYRANSMKQDASLDFMRRVLEYADTRFAVDVAV